MSDARHGEDESVTAADAFTYKPHPSVRIDALETLDEAAKANKVKVKATGSTKVHFHYGKAFLGVVFFLCVAFCVNIASSAITILAFKDTEVKLGVLADREQHILATAQAHAVVPLFIVVAMTPAELGRVKQLTVSYVEENLEGRRVESEGRVETTLDIIERKKIDNMTVQLDAASGKKVVVHGDTAYLIMTDGTEVPVCGGNADCSSFEVLPVFQHTHSCSTTRVLPCYRWIP